MLQYTARVPWSRGKLLVPAAWMGLIVAKCHLAISLSDASHSSCVNLQNWVNFDEQYTFEQSISDRNWKTYSFIMRDKLELICIFLPINRKINGNNVERMTNSTIPFRDRNYKQEGDGMTLNMKYRVRSVFHNRCGLEIPSSKVTLT